MNENEWMKDFILNDDDAIEALLKAVADLYLSDTLQPQLKTVVNDLVAEHSAAKYESLHY